MKTIHSVVFIGDWGGGGMMNMKNAMALITQLSFKFTKKETSSAYTFNIFVIVHLFLDCNHVAAMLVVKTTKFFLEEFT